MDICIYPFIPSIQYIVIMLLALLLNIGILYVVESNIGKLDAGYTWASPVLFLLGASIYQLVALVVLLVADRVETVFD